MEAAARKVDAWRQAGEGGMTVRIAAGTWVAWLLTENFSAIRTPADGFHIALTIGETRANLAYRESDIGIRAFEPEEPNLAARRLGDVAYAVYVRRNAGEVAEPVDRGSRGRCHFRLSSLALPPCVGIDSCDGQ